MRVLIVAATIKDIAKILNVTCATVSKALSNQEDISAEMKSKVRKVAEELHYRPNILARGLVKNESKTIGLIIPDITNPFYPEIAQGIEETINEEGYSLILCNSNWDKDKENNHISLLIGKKVDGLIIAPIGIEQADAVKVDFPIITVGNKNSITEENYVVIDDEKGGYIATSHLIENGCRSILFIGGQENVLSNKDRLRGYKKALSDNNIEIQESNIYSRNFKRESGYMTLKEIMQSQKMPDGIFAGNDILALGIIQAITESGFKIPEDIKVVGFDDIIYMQLPEISLTTIIQPKYEMGVLAAKMLLSKIKNPNVKIDNIILEPHIAIRRTSHI